MLPADLCMQFSVWLCEDSWEGHTALTLRAASRHQPVPSRLGSMFCLGTGPLMNFRRPQAASVDIAEE